MATATRDKLIATAHDLFYHEGFTTVGLDRIIDEVGVTKTTFYNHFQSKDDLILAVLEQHDRWWRDTFRSKLRELGGDKPRGQLAALADVLEWMFSSGDFNGCIFVNVAVHFPARHDPAHQASARHKKSMEDILREVAGSAGAADPLAVAQELSFVLEGAYVTRQVMGDPNTAIVAHRMVSDIVNRHIPA
jgi:AcrR family transcriptional regulator